jgi:lipopolysaccharide export system protein LptA
MYKPNLIPSAKRSVALAVFCVFVSSAFSANSAQSAQKAQEISEQSTIANDFLLPVTAKSKNQSLDGKKKTSVFMNNVVIRQGSLEILADQVIADAIAGKGKEIITATGSPASYRQRLEDGSIVSASANEIQYQVEFQIISLRGNAAINQNDIKVNGDSITFDMGKEQIVASTDANSDATVTTVLSPGAFSQGATVDKQDKVIEDKP